MNIVIDKDNVSNYGVSIKEYAESLNDYIKKFNSIIESINTAWEGDDSLKYINVMKEKYIVELEKLKDIVGEYGEYLKYIPDVYSALDEVFSTKKIDG